MGEQLDQGDRFVREPLGVIAAHHGLLTPDQIDLILDQQRNSSDRFGEIAVELGLLESEQVGDLVQVQGFRSYVDVAEVLVLGNVLSFEDVIRYLGSYLADDREEIEMIAGG